MPTSVNGLNNSGLMSMKDANTNEYLNKTVIRGGHHNKNLSNYDGTNVLTANATA